MLLSFGTETLIRSVGPVIHASISVAISSFNAKQEWTPANYDVTGTKRVVTVSLFGDLHSRNFYGWIMPISDNVAS